MPQHIIKINADGKAHYLQWSTIVDAPVAGPGTRQQMREHLIQKYGTSQADAIDGMLSRADECGTSDRIRPASLEDTIRGNRAGEKETCLTLDQIIEVYIRGKPNIVGTRWQDEPES